ncbi:putative bifunctional diguanylate cyclase/phosphodiesterase [Marinobacterium marinum]|uniref:EAL domain-containing protein n=1 Tax=Marinobacterium marinum TaxID=2756129 RepID=A0A7W1X0L4_9GAMM|nr:EAL domain-containing protein [Marinobacterium marinum]MBA4503602.1 EAL domain-containing protein [Marinobacterium marinum]
MPVRTTPTDSSPLRPALILISHSVSLETCWRDWLPAEWADRLCRYHSIEAALPILQQPHTPIVLLEPSTPDQTPEALQQLRRHRNPLPVIVLHRSPRAPDWQPLLADPWNDHLHLPTSTPETAHRALRYCCQLLQPHTVTPAYNPTVEPGYDPALWRALQHQEFELYYQPRINLRTGTFCGAEALTRWHHPKRGLLSPDHFIPACESSGLIVPLGYWVLQEVGAALPSMQAAGLEGRIGINLSFRQFQDRQLAPTIERLMQQQHMDARNLEFELTETALYHDEKHLCSTVSQLSDQGVEFSLDDFGTGYSSFSLLQKLPIATLKIDKSFLDGIPGNSDNEEIVRAIISLAHNLNKQVIAEGVETRAQLDFLMRQDCDQAQGYFFSRPVALTPFLNLLSTSHRQQAL